MPADVDPHRRDVERLRDGLVVELDRRFAGRERAVPVRPRTDPDVDAEVATTIAVVQQVAAALAELQETVRRQEELIYEQRQTLADLQQQRQSAYAELADLDRTLRGERERADRAESRAASADAQVRRLEDYSVSLKSHLTSLMGVVRSSLAAEPAASSRGDEAERRA